MQETSGCPALPDEFHIITHAPEADFPNQLDGRPTPAKAIWIEEADAFLVAATIQALVAAALGDFVSHAAHTIDTKFPDCFAWCHLNDSFAFTASICSRHSAGLVPVVLLSPMKFAVSPSSSIT
jgi:hypothetical protein